MRDDREGSKGGHRVREPERVGRADAGELPGHHQAEEVGRVRRGRDECVHQRIAEPRIGLRADDLMNLCERAERGVVIDSPGVRPFGPRSVGHAPPGADRVEQRRQDPEDHHLPGQGAEPRSEAIDQSGRGGHGGSMVELEPADDTSSVSRRLSARKQRVSTPAGLGSRAERAADSSRQQALGAGGDRVAGASPLGRSPV